MLATTDLYGQLYPVDYCTGEPAERRLAKTATLLRAARQQNPNTLLVDTGDTTARQPADAMALRNHEFNFGLTKLNARAETRFPRISANSRTRRQALRSLHRQERRRCQPGSHRRHHPRRPVV